MSDTTESPPASTNGDHHRLDSPQAGVAALRGGALRGGAYVTTILLSLISAPLLVRHLGLPAFGRYQTVIALATIVAMFSEAGLMNIASREWATNAGPRRRRLMASLLSLRLILSTVGIVTGVAFAAAAGYPKTMVIGTLLAATGAVLATIGALFSASLQAELQFGWVSAVDLLRQVVTVALIVALVLTGGTLVEFLATGMIGGAVALVSNAILARHRMPLLPGGGLRDHLPLLRDTAPYAVSIALNSLYFRVTLVIMSLAATATQTGYFATSFRVTEVLVGVPVLAVGAVFPILSRIAKGDRDRFVNACERVLSLGLLAGAAVALAVVLIAPFAVVVIAGEAGRPAGPVLQIQGIALLPNFLTAIGAFALLALRRHRALLISNVIALLLNAGLTLALIPTLHAEGAAIAAVIAESCLAATQIVILVRATGLRLPLATGRAVAIAAAVGAAPLLLQLHPVIRTVLGLAAFTIVLALQRQLPPELSHALGPLLRRGKPRPPAVGQRP